MTRLHSCAACGLFGWRKWRRNRQAARLADAALVAFFAQLGAEIRAERQARLVPVGQAYITVTVDHQPPDPQAWWWLPDLAIASGADW